MKKYIAAAAAAAALIAALPAAASATTFAGSCDLAGSVSSEEAFLHGLFQQQIEQAGRCTGSLDGGGLASLRVTYSENLHGLAGPLGLPLLGRGAGRLLFTNSGKELNLRVDHAAVATVVHGSESGSGAALIVPDAGGIKTGLLSLGTFDG